MKEQLDEEEEPAPQIEIKNEEAVLQKLEYSKQLDELNESY
jgi:hypothetical protein